MSRALLMFVRIVINYSFNPDYFACPFVVFENVTSDSVLNYEPLASSRMTLAIC